MAKRKYSVNENYFESIDTEDKAYWVGFITADGSILHNKTHYALRIGLQVGDKGHLLKFNEHIDYAKSLKLVPSTKKNGKTYYRYDLRIDSKKIVFDLEKLGIMPRKARTVKPCTSIPKNLLKHYWRGLIDGDGHICKDVRGWKIGLTGNEFITNGFRDFLLDNNIKSKAKVHIGSCYKGHCVHGIVYSGTKLPKSILKLIYIGSNIYLDRKMESAKKVMKIPDWNYKRLHISKKQLETEYLKLGNWHDVMRKLNVPIGSSFQLRKQKKVDIGWI